MSVNWVLLTEDRKDIIPLQNERIFFREQNVRIELDSSNGGYPGAGSSYSAKDGTLLLTNQRIVYLNSEPTPYFTSASLPISNIHDGQLVQSWFSSPVFKAVVMPVPNGGLTQPARLSITFASKRSSILQEFDVQYRSLRERLQELDGAAPQHLEELPTYTPASATTASPHEIPTSTSSAPAPLPQQYLPYNLGQPVQSQTPPPVTSSRQQPQEIPSDLPPSYN